jgi:predicted RNA-binding Zn-ribbon protein involved in translation (DUF1610 family)
VRVVWIPPSRESVEKLLKIMEGIEDKYGEEGFRCTSCAYFEPITRTRAKVYLKVCPECGAEVIHEYKKLGIVARLFRRRKKRVPRESTTKGPHWKFFKYKEYGFAFTCPSGWHVEVSDQGLEIHPPHDPHALDPRLAREVASPGVNITFAAPIPDKSRNIVAEFIECRAHEGYEDYRCVKFHRRQLDMPFPEAIYEFEYGPQTQRFRAFSSLDQFGDKFFNVTASGRREDFEKYRDTLERIVKSFYPTSAGETIGSSS